MTDDFIPPYDPTLDPACEPQPVTAVPRAGRWPAVRAAHLAKHPACEACGSRTALNVHHCKPYHLFPALELAESNLYTLCECPSHNCHLIWGHVLRWDLYNVDVIADAAHFRDQMAKARKRAGVVEAEDVGK